MCDTKNEKKAVSQEKSSPVCVLTTGNALRQVLYPVFFNWVANFLKFFFVK